MKVHKTFGGLDGHSSIIERTANMAKRNYYKMPKNVSEITEEELEAFASAMYENLMAKFAEDLSPKDAENA